MSQCVVGYFKQVPMLWIDLLSLARAHAERCGIKAPHIVDDAGGESVAAANLVGRGVIKISRGETIRRDPAHAAAIIAQQLPQLITVSSARHATCVTDDRDFAS